MDVRELPTLNAILNGFSALLLWWGHKMIRRKVVPLHKTFMTSAFVASCIFVGSYVVYHFQVGAVAFERTGWVRVVYMFILISHSLMAIIVAPRAVITWWRGWQGDFLRHRAMAKWTYWMWIYVNLTGVIVYLMLYR
jgi:putative membrane protein